jgi:CRISPR-associated protein Cmr4
MLPPQDPEPTVPATLLAYIIRAMTSVHVGCGTGQDDVDQPVMRGQAIRRPLLPGSGLKGCLRDHLKHAAGLPLPLDVLFGPEREATQLHAGMLCPQDARLLALPVASGAGGWAWVSTAQTLARFQRDVLAARGSAGVAQLASLPEVEGAGAPALVAAGSPLCWGSRQAGSSPWLMVHDFHLRADDSKGEELLAWGLALASMVFGEGAAKAKNKGQDAWNQGFAKRLTLVSEQVMDALCDLALEVRTRVSLDEHRVARSQLLWREELVPPDALFWGVVTAQTVAASGGHMPQQALSVLQKTSLQLGGKRGVGHGWIDFVPLAASTDARPA